MTEYSCCILKPDGSTIDSRQTETCYLYAAFRAAADSLRWSGSGTVSVFVSDGRTAQVVTLELTARIQPVC